MALMTRVARLFRADLHAVLDRIEEPEVLLRQALREMEDGVNGERRALAALAVQRDALEVRARDLEHALAGIAEQLDVCFEAGNDALARTLIKRRLETERLLAAGVRRSEALAGEHDVLAQRIAQMEARLGAMRQKAEILGEQGPHDEDGAPHHGAGGAVTEHDVEIALLREKRARSVS